MPETARCPTCKQPMPAPPKLVRSCFDCKLPIGRHHKWAWVRREGMLTCAHRHCSNPTSYRPRGEEPVAPAPLFDGAAA